MTSNVIPIQARPAPAIPPQWQRPERTVAYLAELYVTWGRRSGGKKGTGWSAGHGDNVARHLAFWSAALALRTVADLRGCLIEAEQILGACRGPKNTQASLDLQSSDAHFGRMPYVIGPASARAYGVSLKAFCAWLTERELMEASPIRKLVLPRAGGDHHKRPLLADEAIRLLKSLRGTPWRRAHRRLYELAMLTGLRANELAHLEPRHLNAAKCGLDLEGEWTKNGKDGFQPLPAKLFDSLARNGFPAVPAQTARAIEDDLERIGIRCADVGEGKLCFHSLRSTFSTLLDQAGATRKENQQLMRHRADGITQQVYTHALKARCAQLVEAVLTMISPPAQDEQTLWDLRS